MTPRTALLSLAATAAVLAAAVALIFSSQRQDGTLVLAASSLGGWIDTDDAPSAQWSFAGSDALVRQLLDGAEADILITANRTVAAPFIDDTKVVISADALATNRLVVAVPKGNPERVDGRADLANADLAIAVCASTVPCGQGFEHLDIAVDSFEPSARSVLTRVELNEVDAGIVFSTDAAASETVEIVPIDLGIAESTYWIFALNPEQETLELRDWLLSGGTDALLNNGFGAP